MEMLEALKEINQRVAKYQGKLETEEATKTSLVMPFIQALGYDVFNPDDVVPEFVTDIGTKKGEKVDYLIKHNGEPIMIFECKKAGSSLNADKESQLLRYFHVSKARFGILTDGITYKFFTDSEAPNKMDPKPFLIADFSKPDEQSMTELSRFSKMSFNIDDAIDASRHLKYKTTIKSMLTDQLNEPSEGFVRFFASQAYSGQLRQNIMDQFMPLVRDSLAEWINERTKERLRAAMADKTPQAPETTSIEAIEKAIETTDEELEGFRIVRAVLRKSIPANRVAYRDGKVYFSVLLDNNNRKPICRLYLNGGKKILGIFNNDAREEKKVPINEIDDLYNHADALTQTISIYEARGEGAGHE